MNHPSPGTAIRALPGRMPSRRRTGGRCGGLLRGVLCKAGLLALLGIATTGLPPANAALLSTQSGVPQYLHGVDMASTDDAWAVGWSFDGTLSATVIDHWDGSAWTELPGSVPGGFLYGVSAISSSDAWAVGNSDNALVMHWNGTKWKQMLSPSIPGVLYGVTATSKNDVWAVGIQNDNGHWRALTEHWDGGAWAEVPSPVEGISASLLAVSAASTDDAWATGYFDTRHGVRTLIEHWDGSAWTRVPSASPGFPYDTQLTGVTSVSTNDVWTAGYYISAEHRQKTLVEHWDGTAWSKVPSPTPPPGGQNFLFGISAATANAVWAVGARLQPAETVIEGWGGKRWTRMESPSPPPSPYLYAVSALSPTDAWAVGDDYSGETTIFLHWDGSAWSQM